MVEIWLKAGYALLAIQAPIFVLGIGMLVYKGCDWLAHHREWENDQ